MPFSLLVASSILALAHAGCFEEGYGDCLAACRSCPPLVDEGPSGNPYPFKNGSFIQGDCLELRCAESSKRFIVNEKEVRRLICYQGTWQVEEGQDLEPVDSGKCLTIDKECSPDAVATFVPPESFQCNCKPGFTDLDEEFEDKEPGQVCSQCKDKNILFSVLVDTSGSLNSLGTHVITFLKTLAKFAQVSSSNKMAIMTTAFTWRDVSNYETGNICNETSCLEEKIDTPPLEFQFESDIAAGLEAVKAKFVQPLDNTYAAYKHALIIVTDGLATNCGIKKEIYNAVRKLVQLGADIYAVGTKPVEASNAHLFKLIAGDNVFYPKTNATELEFAIPNELQKVICSA